MRGKWWSETVYSMYEKVAVDNCEEPLREQLILLTVTKTTTE